MLTSAALLLQFSNQMKSKGLLILISIRMVIGWIGVIAAFLNWGKPPFWVACFVGFYFLSSSFFAKYKIRNKLVSELGNLSVITFLIFDFLIILSGFYLTILSHPRDLVATPIQNAIFFSIFFLYQLYISFFLHRKFSAMMGMFVTFGYVGGLILATLNGAEFFTGYRLVPQTPNRIVLPLEILKVILLLSITICIIRLVTFLLDILENNNKSLVEELNKRETLLLKNDRLVTLGTLASNVAHEINNPLAGIKSMSEFLFEEELSFLTRKEPLWREKEKQIFWKHRTRTEKREDYDLIMNLFYFLPKEYLIFLADRCIDIGVDYRSFEGLTEDDTKEWDFVFLWLKFKTMEKSNLLVSNAISRTEKVISTFRQFSLPLLEQDKSKVSVGEGIRDILFLYHQYWERSRRLVTEIDDQIKVFVSEPAMKLVWSHLLFNAIQATSPHSGEVKIRASLKQDSEVEVAITDNGPGIPDSLQNQIFQPFFTTKDQGEGIGLGLYISKEIIKNQNGRIQFESLPGKTTFTVILPVAE
ncbi:phospho-acceptor domain-containing protein [Leptospira meyeri]|uniref:histidine kinase n=2 Tax=Leptospira meyeri TaxID=29508 RepID=A0A4R8MXU9_LEPME|nr:ATP-binding protein [Leptospira meyeri]EKJ85106.1 signal transduction histidine-protein kinase AtoS family protein [Leptospira meyeri serovar Hardjo str. Went 5]TDY71766.1 phospho-acceptor domain-containing protein [Leptospira meyeri]TGL48140.1 two-component sensor histidine kinase [Leptospira meyeri]